MSKKKSRHTKKTARSLRFMQFFYRTFGAIFPNYVADLAYKQWSTTMRFKPPAHEQAAIDYAQHDTINVNDLDITVYIWPVNNLNKTLLFIHGWTGRGTQIVNYIKPLNALGYRVISFDGPAHGRTSGKQTSMLEFTDVVFALDEKYGNFDAAITHSFGGLVITYAMSLGLNIKKVACLCPAVNFYELIESYQRILTFPDTVKQIIRRKLLASHGRILQDSVNLLNNADKLTSKALIIHDKDDAIYPCSNSEKVAKIWPGSTLLLTEGLGHTRIIHDKKVIHTIVNFMTDKKA